MKDQNEDHWLVRPSNIRLYWIIFIAVLALTIVADLFVKHKPYFAFDDKFAFSAWYGFGSAIVMVIIAKTLGIILKRSDTYYND